MLGKFSGDVNEDRYSNTEEYPVHKMVDHGSRQEEQDLNERLKMQAKVDRAKISIVHEAL